MHKILLKTFLHEYGLFAYFFFSLLYLEIFLMLNMETPVVWIGLYYNVLFSAIYSLLFVLLLNLLPTRIRIFSGLLLLFIITILFSSQLIYYKVFKTFFTVYSAAKGGQVLDFIDDILHTIRNNIHWLVLFFIPFISYFFISVYFKSHRRPGKKQFLIVLSLAVCAYAIALLSVNLGNKDQNSPYDMYYKTSFPISSVSNLGLMTTMRIDLKRTVFGFDPYSDLPSVSITPTPKSPDQSGEYPLTPTPEPEIPIEYNAMDIDFEALIAQESDPVLLNMHQYFSSLSPSRKNEYTGLFQGYNLIFLTAEAYSHYAVDPVLTPTLYKMATKGYYFENFYNPVWGVSTSDGEYVATTGLIPKPGVWSMYKSGSNSMPFAMGNQLRRLGYKTMAYHNHTYTYYKRDISHPNLGYEYKGIGNGLDVKRTWPASDLEMMEKTVTDFIGHTPFHAYYMTISGHLRYNFTGNYIALKNKSFVMDLPYMEAGRAYLATQIELDRALEYLLRQLKEEGLAEQTLFVMSADHYLYGLEKNEIDDLASHTVEGNFELHKSSLIIYAEGMTPETIDAPVSSLDIIPTLSNLLGLEFDSRLLFGRDVFSDNPALVIFANKSYITDKGRYNAVSRKFESTGNEEVSDEYQKAISDMIDQKFFYSAKILDTDYYAKVLQPD
jgi:lipoteichoic acid synthase